MVRPTDLWKLYQGMTLGFFGMSTMIRPTVPCMISSRTIAQWKNFAALPQWAGPLLSIVRIPVWPAQLAPVRPRSRKPSASMRMSILSPTSGRYFFMPKSERLSVAVAENPAVYLSEYESTPGAIERDRQVQRPGHAEQSELAMNHATAITGLFHGRRYELCRRVLVRVEQLPGAYLGVPGGVAHVQRGRVYRDINLRCRPVAIIEVDKSTFYMQAAGRMREAEVAQREQDLGVYGVEAGSRCLRQTRVAMRSPVRSEQRQNGETSGLPSCLQSNAQDCRVH